jgi:hypothetical protein
MLKMNSNSNNNKKNKKKKKKNNNERFVHVYRVADIDSKKIKNKFVKRERRKPKHTQNKASMHDHDV